MNLLHLSKKLGLLHAFLPQNHQISSSSTRVLASSSFLFSTQTSTSAQPHKPSSTNSSNHSTLHELIIAVRDPRVSILPVLDRWVQQGSSVNKNQLVSLINLMKGYKRFNHALEISHWMTDKRYCILSPNDAAVRLELIQRVHGLEEAEDYFGRLSTKLKTRNAYGAILGGYVQEKSVEKAESIMKEMRNGGMAKSAFPYNLLINLYAQTGDFNKIYLLVQEMESNGITRDKYTLRNLITAFIAESNISGVERMLNLMEENPEFGQDWKAYAIAANAYLKIGSIESALTMLKKVEKLMSFKRKQTAFNFLLTLYAKTGNKDELYRVWNAYKRSWGQMDTSFCCMIQSLSKLDDIEGAEMIFVEWESECSMYDFRVLNRLLVAYCERGLFEKAESAIEKAVEGRTPYASTWNVMAIGYMEHNQMPKAVEMLKRAMLAGRKGWKPSLVLVNACLDYLDGKGNAEEMEEITSLLKKTEKS